MRIKATKTVKIARKFSQWNSTTTLRTMSRIITGRPPISTKVLLNLRLCKTTMRMMSMKETQSRRTILSMTVGSWRASKGSNLTPMTNSVTAESRHPTTFGKALMRVKKEREGLKALDYTKPSANLMLPRKVIVAVWSRKKNLKEMSIAEVERGQRYIFPLKRYLLQRLHELCVTLRP